MLGDTMENWPTVSGSERYSLPEFTSLVAGQLYAAFEQHTLQTSYYYDFGTLADGSFQCGSGTDWRQTAIHGPTYDGYPSAWNGGAGDVTFDYLLGPHP